MRLVVLHELDTLLHLLPELDVAIETATGHGAHAQQSYGLSKNLMSWHRERTCWATAHHSMDMDMDMDMDMAHTWRSPRSQCWGIR